MRSCQQRGRALALAGLLFTASAPVATHAQTSPTSDTVSGSEPEDSPRYRALITQAVVEMDAGHYPEARALFAEVHALAPNARTLRGLGIVAFELRDYVASVRYLEDALSSTRRPLTDVQREELAGVLTRARGFIGSITVDLVPVAATLWIDGSKVHARGALPLTVGDHEFEARAAGFLPARRSLHVTSGQSETLRIALDPVRLSEPGEARALSRDESPRWYASPWLWTAAAVVLGGAIAGVVVATTREPTERVLEPPSSPNTPVGGQLEALWRR